MRYCPNIPCPHRQRVGSPAEFFDHVLRCSDCATRLVASEADAMAGLQPDTRDPYRARTAILGEEAVPIAAAPRRRPNDAAVGLAWFAGGLLLMVLTFGFAFTSGGVSGHYLVPMAPVLYGVFRILRSAPRKS